MIKKDYKIFLQKKFLLFYFSVWTFIMLIITNFVIGFYNKTTNQIVTLKDLGSLIRFLNQNNLKIPNYLKTSYFLIICGLTMAVISTVFLFLNLFEVKKITKQKQWFYWIVLISSFLSFALTVFGKLNYVIKEANLNASLAFDEVYDLGRLLSVIGVATLFPTTLFFLVWVWKQVLLPANLAN